MEVPERTQMDRQHIFAVNGSPDFLDVVRELFQEEDYNVTTTNYVPRTFAQIMALDPSLLIIDLVVGQQAGWDLLEELGNEAATRGIPIVVLSTNPQMLARAQATFGPNGHTRFLGKPFDLDDLVALVRDLIGPA